MIYGSYHPAVTMDTMSSNESIERRNFRRLVQQEGETFVMSRTSYIRELAKPTHSALRNAPKGTSGTRYLQASLMVTL